MTKPSRQTFLKGSAPGVAAMAAGSFTSPHAQQFQNWDETVEVIVIVSAFAGLAAAIEAKRADDNVIVLGKMPTLSDNSIINGDILSATGCKQKMYNIEDSVDLLEKDILVADNYLSDKTTVRYMAEKATELRMDR